MTSGLEDALSLSRHLFESRDVEGALAAFEAERLPIVHEYQRTSREMSQKNWSAAQTGCIASILFGNFRGSL